MAMSEVASIGQILRQRREERGLTIEQVAFQSKIPLRLLQALEADDYHLLPDALYLIRFLHDLAVFLKLDVNALETEFQSAIRRPPRQTLAVAPPPPPPPTIPWKQAAWTVAAILVITPLVFIVLSLISKRAEERPAPTPVKEQVAAEQSPAEGNGGIVADRFLAMHPGAERSGVDLTSEAKLGAPREKLDTVRPAAPVVERIPRRFVLTARAMEPTWMSVRADGGEQREVLLQAGQVARFAADAEFVVTLGNAGGVNLTLNGTPVPSLGKSGQVIRDFVLPAGEKATGSPGAAPSRETRQTTE